MTNDQEGKRYIIDGGRLPSLYPTHRHTAEFWEYLGRTIATFGFLEEILGKAIFALTGTRRYNSAEEVNAAYEAWLPKLKKALTDQLWNLACSFGKAVHDNPDSTLNNVDELVESIKGATKIRNILCHGSWGVPDEDGKSLPLFVNRELEILETTIDVDYLRQLQADVAGLACSVINTVTHMGWQFPGSAGPGKEIWPNGH